MTSGYGLSGGPSRCFPFWQEVLACYVVNHDNETGSSRGKCTPVIEDYFECLHHVKEATKIANLQAAYRKRETATPRDDAPSAGEIRSLGLLHTKDKDVSMKHGQILPTLEDNRPRGKDGKPIVH